MKMEHALDRQYTWVRMEVDILRCREHQGILLLPYISVNIRNKWASLYMYFFLSLVDIKKRLFNEHILVRVYF